MNNGNKHIIYTAADIRRYITGEMSPEEMHAMEMAALDDPFLAEAMEGYDLMEQKDWKEEIAALHKQLDVRKNETVPVVSIKNSRTVKWWRAAAAVLVLGATAATAYIFTNANKTETKPDVAKLEPAVIPGERAVAADSVQLDFKGTGTDTARVNVAIAPAANGTVVTEDLASTTYAFTPSADAAVRKDSAFMYTPAASQGYIAMNDDKVKEKEMEGTNRTEEVASSEVTSGNSNAMNYEEVKEVAKYKKESAVSNNAAGLYAPSQINGVVVNTENKPVGYANITLPSQQKQVYTDANGRFTVRSADTALNVTVTSAGYNSKKARLSNAAASNVITLHPQDIAITKVGAAKSEAGKAKVQRETIDSSSLEEPAGGWYQYNQYLSNNIRLPEEAKEKNIHGAVEMTVKIKDNGDIATVKIDKPLCSECDAEAIRLVKEGPKWEAKKNRKKSKVKVTVKF